MTIDAVAGLEWVMSGMTARRHHVRFTPESGHLIASRKCRLCARRGHGRISPSLLLPSRSGVVLRRHSVPRDQWRSALHRRSVTEDRQNCCRSACRLPPPPRRNGRVQRSGARSRPRLLQWKGRLSESCVARPALRMPNVPAYAAIPCSTGKLKANRIFVTPRRLGKANDRGHVL